MSCKFFKILKAAIMGTVFLFSPLALANISTFESIKQKVTELLLQKKKSQAVQLIINYSKTELSRVNRLEANELLNKVAFQFIFKEAQEAYENSINLTLENPKEALNNIEQCLSLEPQQLNCLIQKTKMLIRNKNNKSAIATVAEIKDLVPDSKYSTWLDIAVVKNEIDFKNKQIIKNLPDKPNEEVLGLLILELDRSFAAKNYSRAKDLIIFFEKKYADWPELVFYKYKISSESSEEKTKQNTDSGQQLAIYTNKCKSISRNLIRKYRYDIDLCMRSLN
jgi:tetratricopeptide (TPR) repeat protein